MQQQELEIESTNAMSMTSDLHSSLHLCFPDDQRFQNLYTSISSSQNSTNPPTSLSLPTPAVLSQSPSSLSDDAFLSQTPSSLSDDAGFGISLSSTDRRLYLTRFMPQYRELVERYDLCFSHLQEAFQEIDALRLEIISLRKVNIDLITLLDYIHSAKSFADPHSFVNDFRDLSVADIDSSSPTSVLRCDQIPPQQQPNRISLPKSISIRSKGYLNTSNISNFISRNHIPSSIDILGTQRVCVPPPLPAKGKMVGEKENNIEFEVYGQGMFKTELCNKWEETGACPYGDHCQFAHGIEELRPVIRHPRYKTEVCRMVLTGEACPYGHRCHFRHALSPECCFTKDNNGK